MRIFRILKRIVRILFIPKREWKTIATETESVVLVLKYYVWPFIVLGALVKAYTVFTKFSGEASLFQFKIPFTLTVLLFYMVAPLFVLLAGGVVINRMSLSMGALGQKSGGLRLLLYSYTPVFLATLLINADLQIPYLPSVGLISIYSVILFWLGIKPMLQMPSENKPKFLILSAMVLCFLYLIIMIITRISVNLLYPEGVILFL